MLSLTSLYGQVLINLFAPDFHQDQAEGLKSAIGRFAPMHGMSKRVRSISCLAPPAAHFFHFCPASIGASWLILAYLGLSWPGSSSPPLLAEHWRQLSRSSLKSMPMMGISRQCRNTWQTLTGPTHRLAALSTREVGMPSLPLRPCLSHSPTRLLQIFSPTLNNRFKRESKRRSL
jgi:hypothetical protein